jgi:hypothetical protein
MDAIMKIFRESHSVQGTIELGWPDASVQVIGSVLLVCTILYIIPRTSFIGAILLTGYLGGAIATMARTGNTPFYFPLVMGVLIWVGLYLRDSKLRELLSFRK